MPYPTSEYFKPHLRELLVAAVDENGYASDELTHVDVSGRIDLDLVAAGLADACGLAAAQYQEDLAALCEGVAPQAIQDARIALLGIGETTLYDVTDADTTREAWARLLQGAMAEYEEVGKRLKALLGDRGDAQLPAATDEELVERAARIVHTADRHSVGWDDPRGFEKRSTCRRVARALLTAGLLRRSGVK